MILSYSTSAYCWAGACPWTLKEQKVKKDLLTGSQETWFWVPWLEFMADSCLYLQKWTLGSDQEFSFECKLPKRAFLEEWLCSPLGIGKGVLLSRRGSEYSHHSSTSTSQLKCFGLVAFQGKCFGLIIPQELGLEVDIRLGEVISCHRNSLASLMAELDLVDVC